MTGRNIRRILALCVVLLFVFAFASISFKGEAVKAEAATVNASAKSDVLSTEEYYRLLYLNDVARSKNVSYDFERSGYDPAEIEVSMNGIKLLGNLNLACIALGFAPKIGKPVKLIQSVMKFISVYQINANNLEMMNQMTDNLAEIYNSLSSDIENQTRILTNKMTEVANYVSDVVKKSEYASIIREFSASGFDNDGGYYSWKKNLLSRYNTLIFFLDEENNADESEIKNAYDYLYICAKKSEKLLSYVTSGEYVDDISIQEVLYRYYLIRSQSDNSLSMAEAVNECMNFVHDIYTTYLFARICLTQCYSYQTDYVSKTLAEGASLSTKQYELDRTINTDNRSVSFYNEIFPYIDNSMESVDALTLEILRYYARILGLNETYRYENNGYNQDVIYNAITTSETYKSQPVKTEYATLTDRFLSVNNKVVPSSKIYMKALSDALTFDIDVDLTFDVSNEELAKVDDNGVVEVLGDEGTFEVYYRANGEVIYSTKFIIEDDRVFSGGGLGTAESPFVLLDKRDLEIVAGSSAYWNKHFILGDNISAEGFGGQIGNLGVVFTGSFDGNNYSISGITNALFGKTSGTIKNLTVKSANVSGKIVSHPSAYAGVLSAINSGSIINCKVEDSTLNVSYTANVNLGDGSLYNQTAIFTGALCGYNSGTVAKCVASGNTIISAESNGTADGGGSPEQDRNFCGGLIGSSTGGRVTDCLSANNNVSASIHAVSFYIRIAYLFVNNSYVCNPVFNEGGLIGEADGATVARCVSYGNNVTNSWSHTTAFASGNTSNKELTGTKTDNTAACIGLFNNSNNVSLLYCDVSSSNATRIPEASATSIETMNSNGWKWSGEPVLSFTPQTITVFKTPIKTSYALGSAKNLSGLVLVTDTGNYISDNITINNFSTEKDGTVTVYATWNGMQTSFPINVQCEHELEERTIDSVITCTNRSTTVQYVCKNCNKVISTAVYEDKVGEDQAGHVYDNSCDTTCNICGHIREIQHTWDGGRKTKNESCTEDGEILYTCTVCGAQKKETVLATGHSYKAEVKSPGCEEVGYTVHTCSSCSDTYIDTYTDPIGHDWRNGSYTVAPTCTEDGERLIYCSRCDKTRTEKVDKLGHNYNAVVTSPTCTEDGFTTHSCSRCDSSYTDSYVDALGHNYLIKVVAPTCTERGYTTHTCSRCKDEYADTYVAPLGHDYSIVRTIAPTCTDKGYTSHTCLNCGDVYNDEYIDALGHDYGDWSTTKQPTCTEKGEDTRYCSRDHSHVETRDIAALGHDYGEWTTTKEPTCTENGVETRYCSRDHSHIETRDIAALGHDYGEWTKTKDPTCTEKGAETRYCSRDHSHVETRAIAAIGHDYLFEGFEWTDNSAKAKLVCSHNEAHIDYKDAAVSSRLVTAANCQNTGLRTYTATYNGQTESKDVIIPMTSHVASSWIVVKPATETEEGFEYKECIVCGERLEEATIAKVEPKPETSADENSNGKSIMNCFSAVSAPSVALFCVMIIVTYFITRKHRKEN